MAIYMDIYLYVTQSTLKTKKKKKNKVKREKKILYWLLELVEISVLLIGHNFNKSRFLHVRHLDREALLSILNLKLLYYLFNLVL